MALSGLNKNEEALGALERALRINPEYADARKARASVSSRLGVNLDDEEEPEKEKPKVRRSVWTRKEPKGEEIEKNWGKGKKSKKICN